MALTPYSGATNYISNLDNEPNDVGGLTAEQFKAKFDQFGAEFVAWFNGTHLGDLAAKLLGKTGGTLTGSLTIENSSAALYLKTSAGNPGYFYYDHSTVFGKSGIGAALTIDENRCVKVEGSAWNGSHFIMGNYHFWVDSSGKLRTKSSAPSSDTDGTVVGTQT
jgi:hypothetical protein